MHQCRFHKMSAPALPPHFSYHPSTAVSVSETATTQPDHSKSLPNHLECSVVCELWTACHKTFGYV
jgi:hypothetical protein